ncbi:hypothetical protein TNCT_396101 [Trichonephila clavata]|uniref:Uncharacterized protein n=1 Tax=Trichonephila clavata TaxID=2740835 RepID=A0A8X6KVA3_TRICU|nr:hypothetical protein TNCT_396101 [Trichonephila clavata]
MNYVHKQNKGKFFFERLSLLTDVRHSKITVNVQNDIRFPGRTIELFFTRLVDTLRRCVRINARYCMKDVTLKFIKRMGIIPGGDIFQISLKEKSGIDKSGERGGQSLLERT